jgi:hypothetical protein
MHAHGYPRTQTDRASREPGRGFVLLRVESEDVLDP